MFEQRFKIRDWLNCTKGIIGGNERDPRVEWFGHVSLGTLKKKLPVRITELLMKGGVRKGNQAQHRAIEFLFLSTFAHEKVLYKVLEDLKEIKAGHYAQPLNDQEPAIDAFCVPEGLP